MGVATLAFYLGLTKGLIGTRNTNRIDLEYLHYLPFCQVFSTGDDTQAALAKALMSQSQMFIHGIELKNDIRAIVKSWDLLTEVERRTYARSRGDYPPEKDGSVVAAAWKRFMLPWKPGAGNQAIDMSPEERKRLMETLRPIIDAVESDVREAKKKWKEDDSA